MSTPSGVRLFLRRWSAPRPRAAVAIVHGFGEHGGRYDPVARRFVDAGFAVYAHDQRGHGQSPGRRGHVDSWGEYRDDVGAMLARVRAERPEAPLFLYGHSMGSLVAMDFLLHHAGSPVAVRGVVASAIGLRPGTIARRDQILAVRLLSRLLPTLRLPVGGVDGRRMSTLEAEAERYRTDPLVHAEATLAWGREALAAVDRVRRRAREVAIPALVTHGGDDEVVLPEGSRELHAALGHPDKELRIYEGARHEPHNDACRDAVVSDIVAWVGARIS